MEYLKCKYYVVNDLQHYFFQSTHQGLDTQNVKSMTDMFYKEKAFNQPIESWNTRNI